MVRRGKKTSIALFHIGSMNSIKLTKFTHLFLHYFFSPVLCIWQECAFSLFQKKSVLAGYITYTFEVAVYRTVLQPVPD